MKTSHIYIVSTYLLVSIIHSDYAAAQSFVNTGNVTAMAYQEPYLWCGTRGTGLIRYNIHDMSKTVFTTADGLAENSVEYVCACSDGSVWAGVPSEKVSYYNGNVWKAISIPRPETDSNYPIYRVTSDDNGNAWIAHINEDFSSAIDGEITTHVRTDEEDHSYAIGIIKATKDGTIYGINPGAYIYREGKWEEIWRPENRSTTPSCIEVDTDNRLWIGLWGNPCGILVYDHGDWSSYSFGPYLDTINKLIAGPDGVMWVSTDGGIIRIQGESHVIYDGEDGLPSQYLQVMAVDENGKPFAGYPYGNYGVYTLDGDVWTKITQEEGPLENEIYSIEVDSDNRVWAGSPRSISCFDGENWERWHHESHFDGDYITEMTMSPTGEIWVGTKGGIACLEGESWTLQKPWESYIATDSLKVFCVDSIDFEENGSVWAATRGAGLFHHDGTAWQDMTPVEIDYTNDLTPMTVTPDGNIWYGNTSGLYRFDGSTWAQFDLPEDWDKPYIYSLSVGPDGALWVAGYGMFARYHNSSWTSWTEFSDQLRMADITCVYGKSLSDIWIGTYSGLFHYDGKELHRYITLDDHSVIVIHDICAVGNGLLFATDFGILQYNIPSMAFKEVVPDFISAVDDNDTPLPFNLEVTAFPNPFNPSTTITFSLGNTGHVTLDVFSISGQKVTTLVDATMSPGIHTAIFNGSGHASGVYFYLLKSDSFEKTGKVLLMK